MSPAVMATPDGHTLQRHLTKNMDGRTVRPFSLLADNVAGSSKSGRSSDTFSRLGSSRHVKSCRPHHSLQSAEPSRAEPSRGDAGAGAAALTLQAPDTVVSQSTQEEGGHHRVMMPLCQGFSAALPSRDLRQEMLPNFPTSRQAGPAGPMPQDFALRVPNLALRDHLASTAR